MPVGIREVRGIATVEGLLWPLRNRRPRRLGSDDELVDLLAPTDIVGEDDPAEAVRPWIVELAVGGELLASPEDEAEAASLEKTVSSTSFPRQPSCS
jgi:hypothetical protein